MTTRTRQAVTFLLVLLSGCGSSSNGSNADLGYPVNAVLYGPIIEMPESRNDWIWGDSRNWLCHQWSTATNNSGYFYGTRYIWSNADVFVLDSSIDPLSVVAAENFAYTRESVLAFEGDTVFFRGRNGFFGAWTIDQIDDQTHQLLSGTWYFRNGGGGDFTTELVEGTEPIQQGACTAH